MIKIIFTIIILVLIVSNTYAINYKDNLIIEKISNKMKILLNKNSLEYRINLENKINKLQEENKSNIRFYNIFQKIKINTYLIDYENEYENHYKKYNIDFNKIKKDWLEWHNIERNNLGVKLYSYDKRLNNTGYEWSKFQKGKNIMSHKREINGPYYDYHQIEKWFNDRGVRCIVKSRATTSESIGKFGYYCKYNNCTSKLIESLKVIFDIYMNEKGLGYPADTHYRGITHSDFSKIGIGISIRKTNEKDYYEYYMTTHYCTEFKN